MYDIISIAAVFDFCAEVGILKTLRIVSYLMTLIKVLIPLLLIIFGAVDFGKAVLASDDKAINKAATSLVTRAIGGIIIFFIPTIIDVAMSLVASWSDVESEFENCQTCLFETSECTDDFLKKNCTKNNGTWDSDTKTCIKK